MASAVSKRSGFTLIEILIVLVIIAQLVAILLPVFSRVRDSARRVTCAGNLKQIGLAIELYVADNDGYSPHARVMPDPNCAWADRLLPYTKVTAVFECPSTQNLSYIPGCPLASTTEVDDVGQATQYDGGYELNRYIGGDDSFPHESTFAHPATTISVVDGGGSVLAPFNDRMTTMEGARTAGLRPPRHFRGHNLLFLDGHTKWMKESDLLVPSLWTATE